MVRRLYLESISLWLGAGHRLVGKERMGKHQATLENFPHIWETDGDIAHVRREFRMMGVWVFYKQRQCVGEMRMNGI